MGNQKVWLITGVSKGMGLEVAKKVLASGDKVIATSRSLKEQEDSIGKVQEFLITASRYYQCLTCRVGYLQK